MATRVKLKTIEVEGKLFDIYVNDYRGEFEVVAAGQTPGHPNTLANSYEYDKLLPVLKRKVKEAKTRVEVPFAKMQGGALRLGVARGIHATKSTVLVTWSNGEKGELDRYERDTFVIPPQDVIEEVNALAKVALVKRAELLDAEKALGTALKPYAMKPDVYARGVDQTPTIKERVQGAITATIQTEVAKERVTVQSGVADLADQARALK